MHITRAFDTATGRVAAIAVLAVVTFVAAVPLGLVRAAGLAVVVASVARAVGELVSVTNATRRWQEAVDRSASSIDASATGLVPAVDALGTTLGALGAHADTIRASLARVDERLDELGSGQERWDELTASVEAVRGEVHALQGSLGQVRRTLAASSPSASSSAD